MGIFLIFINILRAMRILFFLLIFLPFLSFSQVKLISGTELRLRSINGVIIDMGFSYVDGVDLLVVGQIKDTSRVMISNYEVGRYFLKKDYSIIFTSENNTFRGKFLKEEEVLLENGDIKVYRYYLLTRSKLNMVLNNNIDRIEIVRDDMIDTFELTYKESVGIYNIVYMYYKFRDWR